MLHGVFMSGRTERGKDRNHTGAHLHDEGAWG